MDAAERKKNVGKIQIKECLILEEKENTGLNGKKWKQWLLGWEQASFLAGQFVMAEGKKKEVNWPSPLLLQKSEERGVWVYVQEGHPLFEEKAGDSLTLWGMCGSGRKRKEQPFALLSDEDGLLLLLPFLMEGRTACKQIFLMGESRKQEAYREWINHRYGSELAEKLQVLEKAQAQNAWKEYEQVYAALPLERVKEWMCSLGEDSEAWKKITIFTGVKVGCGIGACRGCYIHNKEGGQGIAVCQEGPFLPITRIPYERDQNFLYHYFESPAADRQH